MHSPKNPYLFNFSSSYSAGGLKILKSYLDFFEAQDGAFFILNSRLKKLLKDNYKKNSLYFVQIQKIKRFFNDEYYLPPILKKLPKLDLYFAYGMPIYRKLAKVNWFHVSNLIPISPDPSHLGFTSMLQMYLLGYRIKKNAVNADIISADSQDAINQTLKFLRLKKVPETKVLRNGLDSSIIQYKSQQKEPIAITIGTQQYKDLKRLYHVFLELKKVGQVKKLKVIGAKESIPNFISNDPNVIILGSMDYSKVLEELSRCSIYLSTSKIENSSIASLEGLFLCEQSYLSTIGSHLEMIQDAQIGYELIELESLGKLYKVATEIPSDYIRSISWENVNRDFYQYLKSVT